MKGTRLPISPDYSSLIGIPYSEMNCWDLAKAFYLKVFCIELKHSYYGPSPDRQETQNLIYSNRGEFAKVEGTPKFGDLIIMKIDGLESHIAIYLKHGTFIHSSKTTGSVIDRCEAWKNKIRGYYRHKGIE